MRQCPHTHSDHAVMVTDWLFRSATDHIVTDTDGITKVTDHFVMETLLENRSGRRTQYL